jgi:hypothetical protein
MNEQERAAFDQIRQELEEIKSELSQLRQQLASRPEQQTPKSETATNQAVEAGVQSEPSSLPAGTGFFEEDEEEDETIALTGDELDNILSTAEFTETAGTAEEFEDELFVPEEEPVQEEEPQEADESVVLEGDESQVDELAGMDIDKELADIDDLVDESEEEEEDSDLEEIELDLDDLERGPAEGASEEVAAAEFDEDQPAMEEAPDLEDFDSTASIPEEADELAVTSHDLGEIHPEEAEEFEAFASEVERDLEAPPEAEEEAAAEEMELPDLESEFGESMEAAEPSDETWPGDEATEPSPEEPPEEEPDTPPSSLADLPDELKSEIRSVLSYMDQLLEALPDDKIQEFAQSEHFEVYKRLFEELGLDT